MNNAFLYSVAAIMTFLVMMALGIWGANYDSSRSARQAAEVRDTTQTIERYRTDSEMLEMQLHDVCAEHPGHSSCKWFTESFKERG